MESQQVAEVPKKSSKLKKIVLGIFLFIVFVMVLDSYNKTQDTMSGAVSSSDEAMKQVDKVVEAAQNLPTEEKKPDVPAEYVSALVQATSYANVMYMSKRGVYAQLVSEYGGKFSAESAQYAIDNVKTDWNENALAKAKSYQDTMHLSPAAIRDQLTSEHGEKFTKAEADYAITHLND